MDRCYSPDGIWWQWWFVQWTPPPAHCWVCVVSWLHGVYKWPHHRNEELYLENAPSTCEAHTPHLPVRGRGILGTTKLVKLQRRGVKGYFCITVLLECKHNYANFVKIRLQNLKPVLVTTHDHCHNASQRVKLSADLAHLQRVFSLAKYSNTAYRIVRLTGGMCSSNWALSSTWVSMTCSRPTSLSTGTWVEPPTRITLYETIQSLWDKVVLMHLTSLHTSH